VKRIQNDVEVMQQLVTETDSAKKRKLLKRRRLPMCLAEASYEEYTVPEAKRSCKDVQRKPLILAPTSMVGRKRIQIHYWMLYG